ncbi:MAG: TPM domain-containing protein [Candidatus Kapaibacterium sp.]|jgi:uncharacterized membrane protein
MSSHTFPPHAADAFPQDSLERISKVVEEVEKKTGTEIKISIRDLRDSSEAGLEIKDLALQEFFKLGVDKTRNRGGVLLFILYDERKFYVVGDEGVHKHSAPEGWVDVARTLGGHFKKAEFELGVIAAVRKIGEHVLEALPNESGKATGEISNEVVMH